MIKHNDEQKIKLSKNLQLESIKEVKTG